MTDPVVTHLIDQQAAKLREDFSDFDVNLADPEILYAVMVTAMVMQTMRPVDFSTFLRCLKAMG